MYACVCACVFQANKRCATGQIRLAASRECVSPPLYSCNITCAPYGGSLDVEMGMLVSTFYYITILSVRLKITHNPVIISSKASDMLSCVLFFLALMPQLSLWALRVCWGALQHILPLQTAAALQPALPRWTPPAQPQRKRRNNLAPGEGKVKRPLTKWRLDAA